MESNKKESRKVLMLPWLARGHTTPFVELAKKLARKHFHIYLCSSPANLQSFKPKLSQNYAASIELVDLHLPSLPDLPPDMHTTNGLASHLIPTLFKAFDMAAPHFSTILQKLNPDAFITDLFQPWATQMASSLNIPAIYFVVIGAVTPSFVVRSRNITEVPFPEIDLGDHWSFKSARKTFADSSIKSPGERFSESLLDLEHSSNIILANTFTEFEGKYIDYLSLSLKKKVIPVAPLVQEVGPEDEKSEILEWLDKKKPKSTVYVSFGSEYYLSKEDREELAHGLEQSGVNFIWVVRSPKGENITIEEALPDGYLERVGERGVVVDGWAPQLKILGHPSIGGFVCHCGWNSVVEAMVFGVPIIALPMQLDQPWHGKVAEEVGVCVEADRGSEGEVQREEVAKAVKELMFEKRGEDLSRKAREISEALKKKEGEIIDGLVAELNHLCEEKKGKQDVRNLC